MSADQAPLGLVSDIWRFPVKSLGGERLRRAFLGPLGLLGDRRQAVIDADGHALTARRNHALLAFGARYRQTDAAQGLEVRTPEGWLLEPQAPALNEALSRVIGAPVRMARSGGAVHDAAPLHLLTSASLAAAGVWVEGEEIDRRRFRANLIVELENPEPFAESGWVGSTLAIGGPDGPALEVISPTERCAVTTLDPDTLTRDNRILAGLARERENLFGVYARAVRTGWIEVGHAIRRLATGDAVQIEPKPARIWDPPRGGAVW